MNHAVLLTLALAIASPGIALIPTNPALAQRALSTIPDGYQRVEGDGWAFAVPQTWKATQYPQPGIGNISMVAQYESLNGDVFVNLVTEPYPGDVGSYLELNLQNMQRFGFTIHSQEPVTVNALEGAEIESSVPTEPATRVLQRLAIANDLGYVLTCRTLETTFSQYRDQCSQIMNTFQVNP